MTESEKAEEWKRFCEACQPDYMPKALLAVLKNEGPKGLNEVLRRLKLERSADLIARMTCTKA